MYTYKHMYILVSNAIVDSLQTRRQDWRVRAEAEGPQQHRGLHEGYYRGIIRIGPLYSILKVRAIRNDVGNYLGHYITRRAALRVSMKVTMRITMKVL